MSDMKDKVEVAAKKYGFKFAETEKTYRLFPSFADSYENVTHLVMCKTNCCGRSQEMLDLVIKVYGKQETDK